MSSFLREHAGPLIGSTAMHAVIAVVALLAAWVSVAPTYTPPASIEAYVARGAGRPAPAPLKPTVAEAPTPEPEVARPAPEPPAPKVEDAALAARRHAEVLRLERDATVTAAEAALEAQRRASEAKRQSVAEEHRRKTEQEAIERKAAAAAADAKRKTAADAQQRHALESDLARQLAAEDHRQGAQNASQLARYVADLQARIERAWNRPPTAKAGLRCEVLVTQVPGGTVTDVRIGTCNGDAAVQQSISLAVLRASPLPAPPDPSLFERKLKLVFEPDA